MVRVEVGQGNGDSCYNNFYMKRPDEKVVEAEIKKINRALRPYGPKKVVLFGSFARRDYHGLSDLDLLIIKETKKKFLDRIVEV